MKIVFLSGAVTKRLDTYKEYFDIAETNLRRKGYFVYNPARMIPSVTDWEIAMRETLNELINNDFDFVYVLKDYKDSKGVKLETEVAEALGIKVIYENDVSIDLLPEV